VKRHWNVPIWVGFAIVLFALVSYIPLFVPLAATRDVPWVTYLLFLVGGWLLGFGLVRAFRDPQHYRGKISGSILAGLSVLLVGLFLFTILYFGKQIPSAANALHPGQPAPAFELPDSEGKDLTLSSLLKSHRAVLLVFYRGYW